MNLRHPFLLALPLAFLAPIAQADTTEYCVADTQAFKAALLDASAKASAAFEEQFAIIKVVQRPAPYQIDTNITLAGMHFDAIAIRGGFNAGCATQVHDVSRTKLEFLGATSFDVRDRFELSGFTVELKKALYVVPNHSAELIVESNHLTLTGTDTEVIHFRRDTDMDDYSFSYSVINNVITTSNGLDPGADGDSACAVLIYNGFTTGSGGVGGPGIAHILNNTIAGTGGSGVCLSRVGNARFVNNIVQDTTTASIRDKDDDESSVTLYHNFLEYPMLDVQASIDQATRTMSPVFVDQDTNFRLEQISPAVNSGWGGALDDLPDFDLDGAPRKDVGSAVDHGAYENPYNDYAAPIVVTSSADTGPNTLREAIQQANASTDTSQRITFELGQGPNDCGPSNAIELESPLPDITDDLEIDGYGGLATPNDALHGFNASLCVVLRDAPGGASVTNGLQVPAAANGVRLTVKGIHFTNFSSSAIALFGGSGHVVQGNKFGGGLFTNNGRAINVGAGVTGALIGGSGRESRNMISTSNQSAIQLAGNANTVVNNLLGPGEDGLFDAVTRNASGMTIGGSSNFIERNTVSGNLSNGLQIQGSGNFVRDNLIGLNDGTLCAEGSGCDVAQGNGRGVLVLGSNNRIERNRIGYNTQQGISVTNNASGNRLRGNRLMDNGGLAIDLRNDAAVDAPTAPDFYEPASAANLGQNFPTLTSASGVDGPTSIGLVGGSLSSRNGTYDIEIFASDYPFGCDDSGYGEGNEPIGTTQVTITNETPPANELPALDGTASFSVAVSRESGKLVDRAITATATSAANNTSEFSGCITFVRENQAPQLAVLSLALDRDTPANTIIVTLSAVDDGLPAPASLTYTLLTALVPFTVSVDGQLTVTQDGIFDSASIYNLDVKVDDGEKSTTGVVTIRPADLFRDGFETQGL